MEHGGLICEQDKQATRLTCVRCGRPICPRCLVRTPVGMKCPACGSSATHRSRRRVAWVAPAAAVVLVVGVAVLPRLLTGQEPAPEEPVRVPNPERIARFAGIGSEARDGDIAFTATSFECGPTEVASAGTARVAQGRFCLLAVELRNNGRAPATFTARAQTIADAQSRQFGVDVPATAAHPANAGRDVASVVVNPGNSLRTVLVFDVPADAEPQTAQFRAGPRGPGAFVRLRPPS